LPQDRDRVAGAYDRYYARDNHFGYRQWLYRRYLRALVQRACVPAGARVLDAGCGQGFFTALFGAMGFDATGIDLSPAGIAAAERTHASEHVRFRVGDVLELAPGEHFDCVFTRSCSLYNDDRFVHLQSVTDALLRHVRPRGVLIFDYFSRLKPGRRARAWRYHDLDDLRRHFAGYDAQTCFSLRIDAMLLGALAFTPPVTRLARAIGAVTGAGGELIAIVRNAGKPA
jgi:SAM-dependent methyltransferase